MHLCHNRRIHSIFVLHSFPIGVSALLTLRILIDLLHHVLTVRLDPFALVYVTHNLLLLLAAIVRLLLLIHNLRRPFVMVFLLLAVMLLWSLLGHNHSRLLLEGLWALILSVEFVAI